MEHKPFSFFFPNFPSPFKFIFGDKLFGHYHLFSFPTSPKNFNSNYFIHLEADQGVQLLLDEAMNPSFSWMVAICQGCMEMVH